MARTHLEAESPRPQPGKPIRLHGEIYRRTVPRTLSLIDLPARDKLAERLKSGRSAYRCSPLQADFGPTNGQAVARQPRARARWRSSPIKYCLYIIKENRAYDQVLGDMRGQQRSALPVSEAS